MSPGFGKGIAVAVITVSDSTHEGSREDKSGPAVVTRLTETGFSVVVRQVVPDERDQIASTLRQLADSATVGAIFTTGGTGVSPRDVTPEATHDVIDREIPGFGELMRQCGREFTAYSTLSRALGGTRGRVLIVNLPGSTRGAVQSLNAILELVPHVLDLINGRTGHSVSS